MRDRLLGRSLCCASISATVFFEKALDFLLVGFHLCDGIRVFKAGLGLKFPGQGVFYLGINPDRISYQRVVDEDPAVIDHLVDAVLLPDEIRNHIILEAVVDLHLDFNIPHIIFLEEFPFVRRVFRVIPMPSAICPCWLAWRTEIADQVFPFFQLLLVKSEDRSGLLEGKRKPVVCGQDK